MEKRKLTLYVYTLQVSLHINISLVDNGRKEELAGIPLDPHFASVGGEVEAGGGHEGW